MLAFLLFIPFAVGTILSDAGCACSTKAPCGFRPDWNGQVSKWCYTDPAGTCGTNQTGYGFVDTCSAAGFPTTSLSSQTLYSNQNLVINWTTFSILRDEFMKISIGRVTLTNGGGVNSSYGTYTAKVTTTANNVSVLLSTVSSPQVAVNTSQTITILPSGLQSVSIINNTGSFTILGQNVSITWSSTGDASSGVASVSIASSFGGGGGGTTVGTAVTNIPMTAGNMTILYNLPRSFIPGSGGTTYSAKVSVVGASGSTYTASSSSFSLVAAPSVSPSITPSNTGTQTPSTSPTGTQTLTPTPTATQTQTPTNTPSTTPSPTPPIDFVALEAAAAASSSAKSSALVGGVIGGSVGFLLLSFAGYRLYQRKQAAERRARKLRAASRRNINDDMSSIYGVTPTRQISVVYQQDVFRPSALAGRATRVRGSNA